MKLNVHFRSLVRLHGSRKRIISDVMKRDLLRNVKQAISSSAKRFSGYQQHVSTKEVLGLSTTCKCQEVLGLSTTCKCQEVLRVIKNMCQEVLQRARTKCI
jgi:hypothetical protein